MGVVAVWFYNGILDGGTQNSGTTARGGKVNWRQQGKTNMRFSGSCNLKPNT